MKAMSVLYQELKFIPVNESKIPPFHPYLEELKHWCRIFKEQNFIAPPGSLAGNLSFRCVPGENPFVITSKNAVFKNNMNKNDFVEVSDCNFYKNEVRYLGNKLPSSETLLHFLIYRNYPKINAVFYGHSAKVVENAIMLRIPHIKYEVPYESTEIIETVLGILENHKFIIIKNNGFLALGETIEKAGNICLQFNL